MSNNVEYKHDVRLAKACVTQPGEEWKTIPSFPDYQVSNQGRVRSQFLQFTSRKSEDWRVLSPGDNRGGYLYVNLRKDGATHNTKVHAVVLEAFVGPRPTINGERACTRHLNGISTDNRVENLAWGTMKENMADKKIHGTDRYARGEDHTNAIRTEAQVAGWKERMAAGEWYVDIANEEGIALSNVYQVGIGKTWAHVRADLDCTPGLGRKRKTPESVIDDVKSGMRVSDIADKYGIGPSAVTRKFQRTTGMTPSQFKQQGVAA